MNALLILVDLGRIRALRLTRELGDPSPGFETVAEERFSDDHSHPRQRLTDQAGKFPTGASGAPGGGTGMAHGERHGEEEEAERQQVNRVAESINALAAAEDGGTDIYLAAPRTIHDRLLDSLQPAVRERIRKSLPLDLTKVAKLDLLKRFEIDLEP